MVNRYNCMPDEWLRQEIAEKEEDLARIKRELESRCGDNSMMYICELCGFQHENEEIVYNHLRIVHRYPDFDAGLSTIQIYV